MNRLSEIMAIHPSIPGIEVTIESNKQPLPEYEDEEAYQHMGTDAGRYRGLKVCNYVECTTGEQFAIRWNITQLYRPLARALKLNIYVDRDLKSSHHKIIEERTPRPVGVVDDGKWEQNSARGVMELRKYMFSKVQTSAHR